VTASWRSCPNAVFLSSPINRVARVRLAELNKGDHQTHYSRALALRLRLSPAGDEKSGQASKTFTGPRSCCVHLFVPRPWCVVRVVSPQISAHLRRVLRGTDHAQSCKGTVTSSISKKTHGWYRVRVASEKFRMQICSSLREYRRTRYLRPRKFGQNLGRWAGATRGRAGTI